MKNRIRYHCLLWMAVIGFGCAAKGLASTYTVVNTKDSGVGTLRQAILDANSHAGPDTIIFNIPKAGTLFNGIAWFIEPSTDLPALMDDGTVIDGTSQAANQGDTNPDGPEVVVSGYQGKASGLISDGFIIRSSDNIIKGLIVNSFNQNAIYISGSFASRNCIIGNMIGLNFSGSDTLDSPNNTGIFMDNHANHNLVGGTAVEERNIISGNRYAGIYFYQADSNRAIGNYIGTDKNGLGTIGNRSCGIDIRGSKGNTIGGTLEGEANLISGNDNCGIAIYNQESIGNWIIGNRIGTDVTGVTGLSSQLFGVYISSGSKNRVGPSNVIRFHQCSGVYIQGLQAFGNTITENSISDNLCNGIALTNGANGGVQSPNLYRTANGVAGTALPYAVVEIFSDPSNQGLFYEGSTKADESGAFSWTGMFIGPNATATMTDINGNTAQFSQYVPITAVVAEDRSIQPLQFSLSQNYPNPFNPSTTIHFSLPERAHVMIKVFDLMGREVATLVDGTMPAGEHAIYFNASGLASGVYFCSMRAGIDSAMRKMVVME